MVGCDPHTRDLVDGWTLSCIPRGLLVDAFLECGSSPEGLRWRTPIVLFSDDVGERKVAIACLEDVGLCSCGVPHGIEDRKAVDWILRAVNARLPTISKQLGADGRLDPVETVIDATVIEVTDLESNAEEMRAYVERDASGLFVAPSEYVVKVTTRSRSEEWVRLASHPDECEAIASLKTRTGTQFAVRCRYDGTEALCHAELPDARV